VKLFTKIILKQPMTIKLCVVYFFQRLILNTLAGAGRR
jgi:hypothetical protein